MTFLTCLCRFQLVLIYFLQVSIFPVTKEKKNNNNPGIPYEKKVIPFYMSTPAGDAEGGAARGFHGHDHLRSVARAPQAVRLLLPLRIRVPDLLYDQARAEATVLGSVLPAGQRGVALHPPCPHPCPRDSGQGVFVGCVGLSGCASP